MHEGVLMKIDAPIDLEVLTRVLDGPAVFPIKGGRDNLKEGMTIREVLQQVPDRRRFLEFYQKAYEEMYSLMN